MDLEVIASGALGFVTGIVGGSIAEWNVHKYILHNPKSTIPFIVNATQGHHFDHHPAYDPRKQQYFADGSNREAVTHFSKGDVALILGASTGLGATLSQLPSLLAGRFQYGAREGAFTGGFLAGAATYYTLYETLHHCMHAPGIERAQLYCTIGDTLQDNHPDGKLRLSVPLLEDLAEEIEDKFLSPATMQRVHEQVRVNKEQKEAPYLPLTDKEMTERLRDRAHTYKAPQQQTLVARAKRKLLRSRTFKAIARHHFMHHIADHTNLNVVLPLMDILKGTIIDSSRATLDKKFNLWHVPNPLKRLPELMTAKNYK